MKVMKASTIPTEAEIQKAFIDWVKANAHRHPALKIAYRIKNDPDPVAIRGLPSKARAIRVARERRMGMQDGMPDFCIPFPCPSLYIEFKSANGKVGEAQRKRAQMLMKVGHQVHFAFSIDSAIDVVEKRLKELSK